MSEAAALREAIVSDATVPSGRTPAWARPVQLNRILEPAGVRINGLQVSDPVVLAHAGSHRIERMMSR